MSDGRIGLAEISSLPAQSGAAAPKTFSYQPSLDGVRAAAVLLVMAAHLGAFLPLGGLGVDIFFVLSGYLITTLLVIEFAANAGVSLKKFYARRALRILPAAILLLLALNIYVAIFDARQSAMTLWNSLLAMFYAANWARTVQHDMGMLAHLWSLSIEEQFYLLWPPALVFLLSRKLSARQIVLLIGAVVVATNAERIFLFQGPQSYPRIYNGTDTRADSLLIGCALGLSGYTFLPRMVSAMAGLVAGCVIAYVVAFGFPGTDPMWVQLTIGTTLFAGAVALVLSAILSHPRGLAATCLGWPPLVWIGRISYGLYLWHFPVFSIASDWISPSKHGPIILIKILLTFLLATLSYYLVERPCLNLKKRFTVVRQSCPAIS